MTMITKERFLTVLDAAGITAEQKQKLHAEFEHRDPSGHQALLEFLALPAEEIRAIRERART